MRPSRAVQAADAIVADVRELGLEVRAGVHVGEVERREGDIAGVAVHIAARISQLAGPGHQFRLPLRLRPPHCRRL